LEIVRFLLFFLAIREKRFDPNYLIADGSVRFLRYSQSDILAALATRAGGEVVDGNF
jgi:hypothetical protein